MSWKILTLKDAREPRPKPVYAVDGMIEVPSVNVVYGAPGAFKSMLVLDMCFAIHFEQGWPGKGNEDDEGNGLETHRIGGVFWVDLDNGKRRTLDRMEALSHAYGCEDDDLDWFRCVSMPDGGLNLMTINRTFEEFTSHLRSGDVVVLDNLGYISGDVSGNDDKMRILMSALRTTAEKYNVAIIVIHHERKSNQSNTNARKGERMRGSSAIEAGADYCIIVERDGRSNRLSFEATKWRDVDFLPMAAQFRKTDEKNYRFFSIVSKDLETLIRNEITRVVKESPKINQGNLVEEVHHCNETFKKKKIAETVKKMEQDGSLLVEKGLRNSSLYTVDTEPKPADLLKEATDSL